MERGVKEKQVDFDEVAEYLKIKVGHWHEGNMYLRKRWQDEGEKIIEQRERCERKTLCPCDNKMLRTTIQCLNQRVYLIF